LSASSELAQKEFDFAESAPVAFAEPPQAQTGVVARQSLFSANDEQVEPEPAPEAQGSIVPDTHVKEEPPLCDEAREFRRALVSFFLILVLWLLVFGVFALQAHNFEKPSCDAILAQDVALNRKDRKICDVCGVGTMFLPLFGEYEKSLSGPFRAVLYLAGLLWIFLGIGVVCDQFMAGIEEITSKEKAVWLQVTGGTKHKFHVKVWNSTVANLTLMALGSSAPEILLNVTEVFSREFFAGELGPSTIVGSAAFNLLVITSVCISAIPAPDIRKIEQTTVFAWTTTMSLFAYMWLIVVLKIVTPDKVDFAEAIITFLCFPLLVFVAFLADKGYIGPCWRGRGRRGSGMSDKWIEAEVEKIQSKFGKDLPQEAVSMMLSFQADAAKSARVSKARIRSAAMKTAIVGETRKSRDSRELLFGFAEEVHMVFECVGTFQVKVVASFVCGYNVEMKYRTIEGTAKMGVRYVHSEGKITFGPHQLERVIEVEIIDNDVWEQNEDFYIELFDPRLIVGGRVVTQHNNLVPQIGLARTTITILNDDLPAIVGFTVDEVYTNEGETVTVSVVRSHIGGEPSVEYRTISDTALEDRDFSASSGKLVFAKDETHKSIPIDIFKSPNHCFEENERFRVELSNATEGLIFNKDTEGGETRAYCDVVILGNQSPSCTTRLARMCCNCDRIQQGMSLWRDQFVNAIYCNGDAEGQSEATLVDWFFHMLSLPWKLTFSIVPPPIFFGGWLCFWCALAMIGLVTAMVGDMAGLLGCCVNIPDDITAITLVALGTSLPDTFASKVAAQQDDRADNSVGNVTGSNSVNVFLGLGLPWLFASYYWRAAGAPSQAWLGRKFGDSTYAELYLRDYPEGGFIVPAGALVFSVIVFTMCALLCVALLIFRRLRYGGELGGPKVAQKRDSFILAGLWLVYITASVFYSMSEKN